MTEPMYMLLPKKKWLGTQKSKTMKAERPESDLQEHANRMVDHFEFKHIHWPHSFLEWMKNNAPQDVRKVFFAQVGGKMPDNIIMVPIGTGMFLAVTLELKTQDKQGRAVGTLHGKQKKYARIDGWHIARSKEQIDEIMNRITKLATGLKLHILKGTDNGNGSKAKNKTGISSGEFSCDGPAIG